jgi:hypothetical protein
MPQVHAEHTAQGHEHHEMPTSGRALTNVAISATQTRGLGECSQFASRAAWAQVGAPSPGKEKARHAA